MTLLLLAGLGACRDSGDDTSGPDAEPPSPTNLFYRPQERLAERALLQEVEQMLVEGCATDQGLEIRYPTVVPEAILGLDRPDMSFRREFGYGSAERRALPVLGLPDPGTPEEEVAGEVLFGGDEDAVQVDTPLGGSLGVGREGCFGDARRRIFGSTRAYALAFLLPEDYSTAAERRIDDDPSFAAAKREWSRCMEGRGHSYPGPYEAYVAFVGPPGTPDPGSDQSLDVEIDVAVSDGLCQNASDMPDVRVAIKTEYVEELEPADRDRLVEVARLRARAVSVAQRLADG